MSQEAILIGEGVIILLVGACIKGIFGIKDQMAKLNGRLGRVETWTTDHEKFDDERAKVVTERFQRMRDDMVMNSQKK